MNIHALAEKMLKTTVEGSKTGVPVVLIGPNGVKIDKKKGTEDPLMGMVVYDTSKFDPETGEDIVVGNPVVTLRRSSLSVIPQPGEKWFVEIPISPEENATREKFLVSPSQAIEGGKTLGVIQLKLTKVVQSE